MKQYVNVVKTALTHGEERMDRTGTGTLSIFGGQMEFDLREFLPIVTIKKTLWWSSFVEMLWFISGASNTRFLKAHDVPIWDDWADAEGNLGPVYGVQWRHWPGKVKVITTQDLQETVNPQDGADAPTLQPVQGTERHHVTREPDIDQLRDIITGIKTNPTGRRHIVTAWNPTYLKDMGLPPCHRDFQCYASNDGHLDLMMAIRSWDLGLGAPFNIAQYALLTHLLARATGLKPRRLIINYGDAHLYLNHVDKMKRVVDECPPIDCRPQLVIKTENTDIDGYTPADFDVTGYEHHPFVKLPIAV